jgi:Rps23 Pro-64 3,4-dihydroxylase Tpa1-like proline 4-hydroxylase
MQKKSYIHYNSDGSFNGRTSFKCDFKTMHPDVVAATLNEIEAMLVNKLISSYGYGSFIKQHDDTVCYRGSDSEWVYDISYFYRPDGKNVMSDSDDIVPVSI